MINYPRNFMVTLNLKINFSLPELHGENTEVLGMNEILAKTIFENEDLRNKIITAKIGADLLSEKSIPGMRDWVILHAPGWDEINNFDEAAKAIIDAEARLFFFSKDNKAFTENSSEDEIEIDGHPAYKTIMLVDADFNLIKPIFGAIEEASTLESVEIGIQPESE